jgi:transposase-like protein
MDANNEIGTTNYEVIDKIKSLYPYQKDKVTRIINDFLELNEKTSEYSFKVCPKCHEQINEFAKGGYTYKVIDGEKIRAKKLIKCPKCHHRFTVDHGQLTFYSHSNRDAWNKVIEDTFNNVPLEKTAADISKHTVTVFHMRHKFLAFLEAANDETTLNKPCEADEKYINECHKGLVHAEVDHIKHQVTVYMPVRKKKAGISHDKVCLSSVIERNGKSYIHAENTGRPGTKDLEKVCHHICGGTFVWTDSQRAYDNLLTEMKCPHKEMKSGLPYDQVNNLNTVNSLHGKIKKAIRQFRNVSSIYINRYAALFSFQQRFAGYDSKEIVLSVVKWLRTKCQYFRVVDMGHSIFTDEYVMKQRKDTISCLKLSELVNHCGYTAVYAD